MTRSRVPDRRVQTGLHVGPVSVTPIRTVVALAFLGSGAFIAYAILRVRDASQIPMLSSGFAVLGLAFAAVAIGALIQLWRAATEGSTGRAMLLGIVGGVVGLAAIGCFTATILLALLWKG
ncbi:MAG TPA: hypothetical protein VNH13_03760 [Candidatus Acidoferrales bacterium]|jgi:hypothetical protein|nr:hypothetical protein [Candidatus Acidoferrales bacterium]